MRVGLLIYDDINTLSGGYLYNRKLITYLQQQGDSVEIISLQQRPYCNQLLNNYDPESLASLEVDILLQDELVHPAVYRTNNELNGMVNFQIIGLVHLFTAYANQPFYKTGFFRHIERNYLRSVDGLILNSQNTLSQARELLGQHLPSYIVAVPAGDNFSDQYINSGYTRTVSEDNRILNLLYVGNVIHQKGLHVLIKSLANLKSNNFMLTVTGRLDMEPNYVKKIQKQIKTLKLENQINFTGPLNHEALIDIYQSNDVFVLPSINEAYGIAYVEAQQFSLPIIGTTAGGAQEIIKHGENGYLISPDDSDQLAAYLQLMHDDRARLQTLSDNAYHVFQQHPTWDDTGHAIRQFLLGLISKSRGNRD